MKTVKCQFCGTEVGDDYVVCRDCSTPHHEDCFRCNGVCTTYACGCSVYVEPQEGAEVKLPAVVISEAVTVQRAKKEVVTPADIRVTHTYNTDLGQHTFIIDQSEFTAKEKNVGYFLLLLLFALVGIQAYALAVGYFLMASLIVSLYFQLCPAWREEFVIDQGFIKYTSASRVKLRTDYGEIDGYFLTMAREEIEAIEVVRLYGLGGTHGIQIKGKAKRAVIGGRQLEAENAITMITPLNKYEVDWLKACISHLATVKRV